MLLAVWSLGKAFEKIIEEEQAQNSCARSTADEEVVV